VNFFATVAGLIVGIFFLDIDPRRRATVTLDVRKLNYRELYRQCPPFFVFGTCTCTSLFFGLRRKQPVGCRGQFKARKLDRIEGVRANSRTSGLATSNSRSAAGSLVEAHTLASCRDFYFHTGLERPGCIEGQARQSINKRATAWPSAY
jgi:hypothetical protein